MAHAAAHAVAAISGSALDEGAREAFYKADHPRAIDQYIDFFGTGWLTIGEGDRCGDLFLESLA